MGYIRRKVNSISGKGQLVSGRDEGLEVEMNWEDGKKGGGEGNIKSKDTITSMKIIDPKYWNPKI
jgi:hypothetical protein